MKYYEIESELAALTEQLLELEERREVLPPEALALLNEYALAATEKRDRMGAFCDFLESRAAEKKAAADRLYDEAQKITNARERLLSHVHAVMRAAGVIVAMGADYKFVEVKGRTHVEIEPGTVLPPELSRVRDPEPDKVAIKRELEAGRYVKGCALKRGDSILAVKRLAATDRPGDTKRIGGGE